MDSRMNQNKEKIISLIMENQNILKCLFYKDNNKNILKMEDLTDKERISLRRSNIFRFRKLPADAPVEQDTYISMEYGDIYYMGTNSTYGEGNPFFKLPEFKLYVISYASLDDNKLIGSRIERIEEEIYNIFHDKITVEDFGKSYLINSQPLYLPRDYVGRQITLRFVGRNT